MIISINKYILKMWSKRERNVLFTSNISLHVPLYSNYFDMSSLLQMSPRTFLFTNISNTVLKIFEIILQISPRMFIKYLFTSNISLRSNISPHILSQFPHFTLSLVRDKTEPPENTRLGHFSNSLKCSRRLLASFQFPICSLWLNKSVHHLGLKWVH